MAKEDSSAKKSGFIQKALSSMDDGIRDSVRRFGIDSQNSEQSIVQQKRDEDGSGGKSKGGGCSGDYEGGDGQQDHETPEQPQYKLEIEENDVPENWWDRLPDFDPRVYDALEMERAAACVKYIFDGLPDVHELENSMEARGFRKICPRLKVQVPRTKVVKPKEIIYNTTVDTFIKKDQTY